MSTKPTTLIVLNSVKSDNLKTVLTGLLHYLTILELSRLNLDISLKVKGYKPAAFKCEFQLMTAINLTYDTNCVKFDSCHLATNLSRKLSLIKNPQFCPVEPLTCHITESSRRIITLKFLTAFNLTHHNNCAKFDNCHLLTTPIIK